MKKEDEKDDGGEIQDLTIMARFHKNQILAGFARAVQTAFPGISLSEEEIANLETVVFSPGDHDEEDQTVEEYEAYLQEFYDIVRKLRPTFMRLFKRDDDDDVEFLISDLVVSNEDVEYEGSPLGRIDTALLVAFRLSIGDW